MDSGMSLAQKLDKCPSLADAILHYATDISNAANNPHDLDVVDDYVARIEKIPAVRKKLTQDEETQQEAPSTMVEEAQIDTHSGAIAPRFFGSLSKQRLRIPDAPVPGVDESDGKPVRVYKNEVFENWGDTVREIFPAYTFVPRTRDGVVNAVRFAKRENLRVRCSGARHSWAPIFGASGEVLLSMMPLDASEPKPGKLPISNPQNTPLEDIQLVRVEEGGDSALVKLGAAATSEHFRQWCLSKEGGDWNWMIKALPIFVEITSAGWTQPVCHGSGVDNLMVPDYLVELEFVNANGEIQVVSDPKQILAAGGSFGMVGVLLSQTFRLSKLQIANMQPANIPTVLAVPPLSRDDVPETNDFKASDFTDEQLAEAQKVFEKDALKFYSEWFWFPFQEDCWVNCWNTSPYDPKKDGRPSYPNKFETWLQTAQGNVGEVFQKTALRLLPGLVQARLFGKTSMLVLPKNQTINASVCDALHFRRGVHQMEVLDYEAEIEIPRNPDGKLELSVVQKAWWMAINAVYREEKKGKAPMRVTLEMRIMGGSNVYMAPQKDNDATLAIEVLTNPLVDREQWDQFIESLNDEWSTLTNPNTGEKLKVLPHWAKEWPRKINGRDTKTHLSEAYQGNIKLFKDQMKAIAKDGGYELEDMWKQFGNDNMLEIINGSDNSVEDIRNWRRFCTLS